MELTELALNRQRWRSFERLLKHVCRRLQPQHILEWGPGVSTQVMLQECPTARILTIEHDAKYFAKAQQALAAYPNVELVLRPVSMKGGQSQSYANYPWLVYGRHQGADAGTVEPALASRIAVRPALVFIDGRHRADCLVTAWLLMRPDAVVIVHDSHRQNYWETAEKLFPVSKQFAEMRTAIFARNEKAMALALGGFDESPPNLVLTDAQTMTELQARFESGTPFCYTRFGDCDLYMIGRKDFPGNKRHDAVPALRRELAEAFLYRAPDYLLGCVAGGRTFRKSKEPELQAIASMFHVGETYYSAVAIHSLYCQDPAAWCDWVKACLHGKRVLLIGGASVCRHADVQLVLNVTGTIETTDTNAYADIDRLEKKAKKNVGKYDVMILALGQAGRVLGWRLWRDGFRTQILDIGSVIDALADRPLRTWIERYPAQKKEVMARFI